MHVMSKKSEEVMKDILYEMKEDLKIDTQDVWIGSRLETFLKDMWEAGRKDGHDEGHREGYDKALSRFDNPEL